MNPLDKLEPRDPWKYFALICSIPHPSGHERELALKIVELAEQNGCRAKMDDAGNVRIDRPASKGFEQVPEIILQGHLDMVPKAAPGKIFDFEKQPVEPVIRDGTVYANGTTLGADNGSGVASALALLFDPELKAGPLAGLFTVQEEVGLIGAGKLDPDMLKGDWLFNLDSGDFNRFCVGCAGGARLTFRIPFERQDPPKGNAFTIRLTGLIGGHSGIMIDRKNGNALILLCRFLEKLPVDGLISLNGGSADNAIPAEAEAEIITSAGREQILALAAEFIRETSREFNAPEEYGILVETGHSAPVIPKETTGLLLSKTASVPNEIFSMEGSLGIVKTSSNFAIVTTSDAELVIHTSQRSLEDAERVKATERIREHFAELGGTASVGSVYPGWPASPDSRAMNLAAEVYRGLYGKDPGIYAIHAGLETGVFAKKNPSLQIISFGPDETDCHTERESIDIARFAEFNRLLRKIIEKSAQERK